MWNCVGIKYQGGGVIARHIHDFKNNIEMWKYLASYTVLLLNNEVLSISHVQQTFLVPGVVIYTASDSILALKELAQQFVSIHNMCGL